MTCPMLFLDLFTQQIFAVCLLWGAHCPCRGSSEKGMAIVFLDSGGKKITSTSQMGIGQCWENARQQRLRAGEGSTLWTGC